MDGDEIIPRFASDLTPDPWVQWASPMVLSSATGTSVDGPLYASRPTYIDLAIRNVEVTDATYPFSVAVVLDQTPIQTFFVPRLDAMTHWTVEDVALSIPEGTHTIELVADPENVCVEKNELNNRLLKRAYWAASAPETALNYRGDVNLGPQAGNGDSPYGLALDKTMRRLYVTNRASDLISVADLSTLSVYQTIRIGRGAQDVVIDPVARMAFAAASISGTVSMIDLGSNQVLRTVSVGAGLDRIVFDPVGRKVCVLIKSFNTIAAIDADTGDLLGYWNPTGELLGGLGANGNGDLEIDPARRLLYATVFDSSGLADRIVAVDAARQTWEFIKTQGGILGLTLNSRPENPELYVLSRLVGAASPETYLEVYDLASGDPLNPPLVSQSKVDITDPRRIYVDPLSGNLFISAGADGGIVRTDERGNAIGSTILSGKTVDNLLIDDEHRVLFSAETVSETAPPQVELVSIDQPENPSTMGSVEPGRRLLRTVGDPAGPYLYTLGSEGDALSVVDGGTLEFVGNLPLESQVIRFVVDPTGIFGYGLRIPEGAGVPGTLFRSNLFTGQMADLEVALTAEPRLIGLSPAGDRVYVAFVGQEHLRAYNANTLQEHNDFPVIVLNEPHALNIWPTDGEIDIVEPASGLLRRFSSDGVEMNSVTIQGSPDGDRAFLDFDVARGLIYVAGDRGGRRIEIVSKDTGQVLNLSLSWSNMPKMPVSADSLLLTGMAVNSVSNEIYVTLLGNPIYLPYNLLVFDGPPACSFKSAYLAGDLASFPVFRENSGRLFTTNRFDGTLSVFEVPDWVPPVPVPDPPEQFKAEALDGAVRLTWSAVGTGETDSPVGVRISRCNYTLNQSAGYFVPIHPFLLEPERPEYIDTSVQNGVWYQYEITAVNEMGDSSDASLSLPVQPRLRINGAVIGPPKSDQEEGDFGLTSLKISEFGSPTRPAKFTILVPFAEGLSSPIEFGTTLGDDYLVEFLPETLRGVGAVGLRIRPSSFIGFGAVPFDVIATSGAIVKRMTLFLRPVPDGRIGSSLVFRDPPPITLGSDSDLSENALDEVVIKGRIAGERGRAAINLIVRKADGTLEKALGVPVKNGLFVHSFRLESLLQRGKWRIAAFWGGGRNGVGRIQIFTIFVGVRSPILGVGKAQEDFIEGVGGTVIVGGLPPGEVGDNSVNQLVSMVYSKLKERRFTDDTLQVYANSDTVEGFDGFSAKAGVTEYVQNVSDAQPLTIYLIGDSKTPGEFALNETETLSADDIAAMLSPSSGSQGQVIIMDSPFAGSFIESLSGDNRAVIASTGEDGPATLNPPSSSFSRFFLELLESEGATIEEAMEHTGDVLRARERTFGSQRPEGAFLPEEMGGLTLGSLYIPPGEPIPDTIPPQVVSIAESSSASYGEPVTLSMEAFDETDLHEALSVSAQVHNTMDASYYYTVELEYAGGDLFAATLETGLDPGDYLVYYQAEDSGENITDPYVSTVRVVPDVTGDGIADAKDLCAIRDSQILGLGPAYDFTGDGKCDWWDLVRFMMMWREEK